MKFSETKSQIRKIGNQKGFSLLELLIYVTLLAVMMMVIVPTFTSFNRGRGQIASREEVSSNLNFALNKITQDLKSASSVTTPAVASTTSSTLVAVVSGSNITYSVSGDQLYRQVDSSPAETVTGSSVKVDSISFTRLENTNPVLSKKVISIKISIGISYNNPGADFQSSGSRETTVSLR